MKANLEISSNADEFLRRLVLMTEAGGPSFPITIYVGGVQISGYTTSTKEFAGHFADGIESGLKKIPLDEKAKASFVARFREGDFREAMTDPSGSLIHLKNAKVYSAGSDKSIAVKNGLWWRGKLESIDGFTFGTISKTWLSTVFEALSPGMITSALKGK